MKKILAILSSLLLLATLGTSVVMADTTENESTNPGIKISPNSYDFGDIIQKDGPVSTTFKVTNTTDEVITINRLSTSCGCTIAEMDLSDLEPRETREMLVTFDPLVHPDQFGEITRIVYLQTSDSAQPEIEIDLSGNVIDENQGSNNNPASLPSDTQAIVFFNEACSDCGHLVKEKYPELFAEYNIEVIQRDYINERENRTILNSFNDEWNVPFELQSHIEAFIGDNLLIGGHVPEPIIRHLLENPDEYEKLLVYQDKMHGEGVDYKVWDFEGEIKTYSLDEPITTYLKEAKNPDPNSNNSSAISSTKGFWGLFAIITSSAFIDGINPCAIAVLLFFIAFLFSLKKSKQSIWKMGVVYIFAIYLAYFLIGIGIAQAIVISGYPHLMAYVGAYLVIGLGIIQILGAVFPKFPIRLRVPLNTKATLEKWLYKATIPASFIGGFVVGLCTFPCSGGIYVAIIGMLATSTTYLQGLGWMVWYNLVFVSPLIIILLLAANPKTTEKLQRLERKEAKPSKILIGLTMIGLGLIILFFFI